MTCWDWCYLIAPIGCLIFLVWIAYWDVLSGSWVSDDCVFSDGKIKPISTYDGVLQQPLSWHNVLKVIRYHYGRYPNPNKRWKEDKQLPYLNSPKAHHRLNLVLFCGILAFLYSLLCRLTTSHIAFLACFLFAIHPIGAQTVGWISGIGYVLGTFWMLLGLNLGFLMQDWGWIGHPMGVLGCLLLYGFCQWMAVEAMFCMVGAVAITLWLHWYPLSIVSGLFAVHQCFNTFKEAITLRKKVFNEQQMGQSTKFYARKIIVAMKTLAYNTKLIFFPKRIGLYHTFCYHYELPYTEHEDLYALVGFGIVGLLGYGMLMGPPLIKLACLWHISFMILFLNWVTANQFVVDRYVWLPSVGACLLVAFYSPPWLYWMICGIALMRLWIHLPTYKDEFFFYQSNLSNFPASEVAWGNMGVVYLGQGMVGSAIEAWYRGVMLNPDYDVSWYNLSSAFRSRGGFNPNYAPGLFNQMPPDVIQKAFQQDPMRSNLHIARYCLHQAIQAKTCHFPEPWKRELAELDAILLRPIGQTMLPARLITPLLTAALT